VTELFTMFRLALFGTVTYWLLPLNEIEKPPDAAFTVSVAEFDVPPPGVGLNTVIVTDPALAMSLASICAVTCVELTTVVVRLLPLALTTEELMKFVPFTVSVNAAPPAVTLDGEMLEMVGTGFDEVTVSVALLEVPPPGVGLNTVIVTDPALAMSLASICAVTCVELTTVVVRLLPFARTTEPLT
jgi:hypothetical protein